MHNLISASFYGAYMIGQFGIVVVVVRAWILNLFDVFSCIRYWYWRLWFSHLPSQTLIPIGYNAQEELMFRFSFSFSFFFFFFLFFANTIATRSWTLNIIVGNTKKYQLSQWWFYDFFSKVVINKIKLCKI